MEKWDGTNYNDVDVSAGFHTIRLSYYPSAKVVSFYLDGDGDGLYSSWNPSDAMALADVIGDEITGMELQ